jgi:hypothetical protein
VPENKQGVNTGFPKSAVRDARTGKRKTPVETGVFFARWKLIAA